MSYSQLVLSQRPLGYWDCASIVSGDLEDLTSYNNHADLFDVETLRKPIIYGPGNSVRLTENSLVTITNSYKIFLTGAEEKSCSLELFFNVKDSTTVEHEILTIGNFLYCYIFSDKIFIESGGKKASIQVSDWDNTQYLCIQYNNRVVSMYLNNADPVSISLGENYYFPDTTPPNIVIGPAATTDLAMYINSIALYPYQLLPDEIYQRMSWAGHSAKADRLAIANNAEILNPVVTSDMISLDYELLQKDFISQGMSNNVLIQDNIITLKTVYPVSIKSDDSSISYDIDFNGLSLGQKSYIKLDNAYYCFNGYNNIISQQVLFDGLSTKQTIFQLGPFIDQSSIHLYKSSSNTIVLERETWEGAVETLATSPSLGSDFSEYFNIAVKINDGVARLIVNQYESSDIQLDMLSNNYDFYLGNSFALDSPLTSKVKNFSINKYSEIVNFTETGLYTLKFNNSFSVSQKGVWEYQLSVPENTISSFVYYNYASKNCSVFVNGEEIITPSFVPNMTYSSGDQILINVELLSSDSVNDIPIFKNFIIRFFQSSYMSSSNGRYRIGPRTMSNTDVYVKVNPFVTKQFYSSPLSKCSNLGLKFTSRPNYVVDSTDPNVNQSNTSWSIDPEVETSGASLTGDSGVRMLEFIIQLDRFTGVGETFTIFDVSGTSIKMSYDSTGLILSSGYTAYLDGIACVGGEDLELDEIYYMVIVFSSNQTSDINIGIDNNQSNGLCGSVGYFAIHDVEPSNLSTYISSRYQAIIGRPYISKLDTDSLNISDLPETSQEYVRSPDGKYFAMKQLPKIKIVQNKWETIR